MSTLPTINAPEIVMWLLSTFIIILTGSLGWFITNTLRQIDKNQLRMSDILTSHSIDIATLKAENKSIFKIIETTKGD